MSTERLTPEKVRAALVAADQTTAARESLCIGLVPKPLPSEVLAELCRQLRGALRRELNGEIVRIVRQKQRMRQGTNFAGFKTGGSHKSNIVYLTSIGVRVGATNLEEVGE